MAAKLNAKLNYIPKINEEEKEEEQPKPTFRKYEEELEINDFPQTARWKVTSKVMNGTKCLVSGATLNSICGTTGIVTSETAKLTLFGPK